MAGFAGAGSEGYGQRGVVKLNDVSFLDQPAQRRQDLGCLLGIGWKIWAQCGDERHAGASWMFPQIEKHIADVIHSMFWIKRNRVDGRYEMNSSPGLEQIQRHVMESTSKRQG